MTVLRLATFDEAEAAGLDGTLRSTGELAYVATMADRTESVFTASTLADEALNAAVAVIQERLGIDSGDFAAQHFAAPHREWLAAVRTLADYAEMEIEWLRKWLED